MASPRDRPPARLPAPPPAPRPPPAAPPDPADPADPASTVHKIDVRSLSLDTPEDQCYVRNSSFLSRDIEAQKARADTVKSVESPPRVGSPRKVASPPKKEASPPNKVSTVPNSVTSVSAPGKDASPPKNVSTPNSEGSPVKVLRTASSKEALKPKLAPSPPKREKEWPPKNIAETPVKCDVSPPKDGSNSKIAVTKESISPPKKVVSPPITMPKLTRADSKTNENFTPKVPKRESSIIREAPLKSEKLSLVAPETNATVDKSETATKDSENQLKEEESNGVGDKIKKFEKVAEDASAGRVSRAGSVRGRLNRLGSDRDEPPPPATPFKDAAIVDPPTQVQDKCPNQVERQQSFTGTSVNSIAARWQRNDSEDKPRPEPQKIIKPEFKPITSTTDVTIRSPSLGAKVAERFSSHGTAFRNVAPPDPARVRDLHKPNDDANAQNNFRTCKTKNKEKFSVSKGSSYFTRGSEEIWLVKKKDIEEIEERVLDSFRRAGGNACARGEGGVGRAASEGGAGAGAGAFPHATTGRARRHAYARSESLDPQWAAARAHTLKRQTSVACTCGHDKKPARPRSAAAAAEPAPRPRSRSHGDDNAQAHVLDKYETLV